VYSNQESIKLESVERVMESTDGWAEIGEGGESILVIDDSAEVRNFLTDMLLPSVGYIAYGAADGESGLALAAEIRPDLVILDARLPDTSGLDVLRQMREASIVAPVILITAHGSEELAIQFFRLGVRDYLIKPFDPDEMLASIAHALREERLERERARLARQLMEANRQLENQVAELAAIVDSAANAVLVTDGRGRLVHLNPAAEASLGQSSGCSLSDVPALEPLARLMKQQPGGEVSNVEVTAEGHTFLAHARPFQTRGGDKPLGWVIAMHDVSRLKELDSLKTEMVTTVAHDLKGPLSVTRASLEMLGFTQDSLGEEQRHMLSLAWEGLLRMQNLVEEVLDLRRVEAGIGLEMAPCRPADLMAAVVAEMRPQAAARDQTIQLDIADDLPSVIGDASWLRRAIANLIDNAIKYSLEGGQIAATAQATGGEVLLSVADQGPGIAPEDQDRLFDLFHRAQGAMASGVPGSGFGLSMVKGVADRHGGRVEVDSMPGRGSTFTIVLPAAS
jgi:signal transduction histidine kinase/DNA-binding response OmpR family regulator